MSEFRIRKLTDRAGTGAPNFTHGFNINGSDSGLLAVTHTTGSTVPDSPSNGDTWWDTGNDKYYVYVNNVWREYSIAVESITWGGTRHVYASYDNNGNTDTIEYFSSVASAGSTAQDFGNLSAARVVIASTSSQTRGLFIGSVSNSNISSNTAGQVIDYITIATTGNATDFGDLYFIEQSSYVLESQNATGNGTRGIIFGGYSSWTGMKNNIEYVTIANTGNAADFGDLGEANRQGGACSDATRAVYARGTNTTNTGIEYVTIATTGNATSFGTQTVNHGSQFAGCSDATRGCFTGGENGGRTNPISYLTIQTTGNTTDFGDLTVGRARHGSTSDGTYGTVIGARNDGTLGHSGSYTERIDRFTIQTTGNATDFADAAVAVRYAGACAGNPS